jgi:serine-type D-Ala-D-Ala carboxypeptidase/endopeptidase (penicillin-binding protein 4)
LPVRKPGLYAGDVFATLARSNGIVLGTPKITPTLPQDAKVLVTQRSGDLRGILKDMLKWSTNLTAEMVGMAASKKRVPELASLRASAEEMNKWAMVSYGLIGPRMADHSGLSDDSRLTASDMVTALLEARGEGLRPILKSIRLRDSRGRPDGNHPIKVAAKTGTLNFVSGLAGYMVAEDGKELAFAIFAADAKERAQISREERERPPGARGWNARAKRVQQELIERWSTLYGA